VLSTVFTAFLLFVILPLVVGTSFHLGVVLPLRRFSPNHAQMMAHDDWSLHDLLPQWIIGVMLLKIGLALGSIGAVDRWKRLIDRTKQEIDEKGIFDPQIHLSLIKSVFISVIKFCAFSSFAPFLIGYLAKPFVRIDDLSVLIFWVLYLLAFQAGPRLSSAVRRQTELALVRRNLLRTKLRNVD
jgi:hypothetical protein